MKLVDQIELYASSTYSIRVKMRENFLGALRAELACKDAERQYANLGRAMFDMTTTVHYPEFSFEEACACIPELWKNCMEERDNLRAAIASTKENT